MRNQAGRVDFENRAESAVSADGGRAVKKSVGSQRQATQRRPRAGAGEAVDDGHHARRRHPVHAADRIRAALAGHAEELTRARAHHRAARLGSARRAEIAKHGMHTRRREFEKRAAVIRATALRGAIHVAIGGGKEHAGGNLPVGIDEGGDRRKCRARAGDHAEEGPAITAAPLRSRAEKLAVAGEGQRAGGVAATRAVIESENRGQRAGRRHFEDGAVTAAILHRHAVEISVRRLHELALGFRALGVLRKCFRHRRTASRLRNPVGHAVVTG